MKKTSYKPGFTKDDNRRCGFTLIELLVVVLIIAILAAVAVPQYRLAVAKSKYATMKHLADALVKAEEVYRLENGTYTSYVRELAIGISGGEETGHTEISFSGGSCKIYSPTWFVKCTLNKPNLGYVYYFPNSKYSNIRMCQVLDTTDITDWRNKVCQSETNDQTPTLYNEKQFNYYY